MNTCASLLSRLHAQGVVVKLDGERLLLRPRGAIPADLLAEIRAHKPVVTAALRHIEGLKREYDHLLARFNTFPDTPESVASREWTEAVAQLNRVLSALVDAGWEATNEEVRGGFGTGADGTGGGGGEGAK